MTSQNETLWKLTLEWMSAGLANAVSSAVLNPMDVAKTRMQAIQLSQTNGNNSVSLIRTLSVLFQESGALGLWKPGLGASMIREMLYSGPRAGFYVPVRNYFNVVFDHDRSDNPGDNISSKICAALVTGMFHFNIHRNFTHMLVMINRYPRSTDRKSN